MAWGYLHLTGQIEEPLITGLKRIAVLALVLGACLRLWLYNTVIVDTFYNAPAKLAAAIIGAGDAVGTIDTIWSRGGEVAGFFWTNASGHGLFGDIGFYLSALVVWIFIGLLCVYAMFLIALSNIALAVLLALGPLFIAGLLFDSTRRFFSAWLAQLANYGLITILTVMVGTLLLQIVQSYATQTAARGSAIQAVDAINMVLVAALAFLLLRQVMPLASGLAGGLALSSFGMISRTATLGMRTSARAAAGAVGFTKRHTPTYGGEIRSFIRTAGRFANRATGRIGALNENWRYPGK
jgi:type IV secretion system protein VirB6